jgi:hypothetical protein
VAEAPSTEPTPPPTAATAAPPARVEEPAPSSARRVRERAARPASPAPAGDYAAPAETPPPRGVMLDEYLRQLDNKIKGGALPSEKSEEPKRPTGQPAPNPFEPIPNNPYDGQ